MKTFKQQLYEMNESKSYDSQIKKIAKEIESLMQQIIMDRPIDADMKDRSEANIAGNALLDILKQGITDKIGLPSHMKIIRDILKRNVTKL